LNKDKIEGSIEKEPLFKGWLELKGEKNKRFEEKNNVEGMNTCEGHLLE
jgi:hypothetical protein